MAVVHLGKTSFADRLCLEHMGSFFYCVFHMHMCSGELKIARLSNDQPTRTEGVFITVVALENPKFDLQTDIIDST